MGPQLAPQEVLCAFDTKLSFGVGMRVEVDETGVHADQSIAIGEAVCYIDPVQNNAVICLDTVKAALYCRYRRGFSFYKRW
jgi:hypothetical protein